MLFVMSAGSVPGVEQRRDSPQHQNAGGSGKPPSPRSPAGVKAASPGARAARRHVRKRQLVDRAVQGRSHLVIRSFRTGQFAPARFSPRRTCRRHNVAVIGQTVATSLCSGQLFFQRKQSVGQTIRIRTCPSPWSACWPARAHRGWFGGTRTTILIPFRTCQVRLFGAKPP